jgi:hypothetical protein
VSDITAMSEGIATNLATIAGIRTYAEIPDNPALPAAVVSLNSVEYDQAFQGGLVIYNFAITVVVVRVTERRAQQRVHNLIQTGAGSVKNAVESDPTLGGAAIDARVTGMTNIQSVSIGDVEYLTAEFAVTVRAE